MIRLAKISDLETILDIYNTARSYMKDNGNPTQWGEAYPAVEMLEEDIRKNQLYVYSEGDTVHGVFMLMGGDEPTYGYIEDGAWKNDKAYGTVHRIAGDGIVRGVFGKCITYCKEQFDNLRIDTHPTNHTMQHLITKYGFDRCGTIYVEDGSERIAYQWELEQ